MKHAFSVFLCFSLLCLAGCGASYTHKMNSLRAALWPDLQSELIEANLHPGAPAFIRVFKEEGILELWLKNPEIRRYQLFKTYPICAYSGLLGPKVNEGDMQSPEGFYDITEERLWPGSKYHLAMNIGFPNEYDEYHNREGSYIMIHGDCRSEGCYAMTNKGIEQIYMLVELALAGGQSAVPVHIFPFRMTREKMVEYAGTQWTPFWYNLKQGYDLFEINHIPPNVDVQRGKYIFPDFYIPRGLKLPKSL